MDACIKYADDMGVVFYKNTVWFPNPITDDEFAINVKRFTKYGTSHFVNHDDTVEVIRYVVGKKHITMFSDDQTIYVG